MKIMTIKKKAKFAAEIVPGDVFWTSSGPYIVLSSQHVERTYPEVDHQNIVYMSHHGSIIAWPYYRWNEVFVADEDE